MKEITSQELLTLEDDSLFYESDLPATAIFQKLRNAGDDDVLVRPIQKDEHMRLGLREMDECDRNSKRWNVLSRSDLPPQFAFPDEDVLDAEIVA